MSILGKRVSVKSVAALVVVLLCAGGLFFPVLTKSPTREFVLVARDMAFHARSGNVANPVLDVKAGETIRVVLRNDDRGMTHDFAVPSAGVGMKRLEWNEDGAVTFQAPKTPGTYDYVCRPHLLMMKGTLRVTK